MSKDTMTDTTRVTIPVTGTDSVSGIWTRPTDGDGAEAVIISHGAANDMDNPLIVATAEGLAAAGYPTLRFNFLYRERGKRSPDSERVLEAAWTGAVRWVADQTGDPPDRFIAAGKSLGGRIAAQMAAEGKLSPSRMIFLGYPLHPPGKPESSRDAPLYRLTMPTLFFAGTRDPFAQFELLSDAVGRVAGATLHPIPGGDHSFDLPKGSDRTRESVHQEMVETARDWLRRTSRP